MVFGLLRMGERGNVSVVVRLGKGGCEWKGDLEGVVVVVAAMVEVKAECESLQL